MSLVKLWGWREENSLKFPLVFATVMVPIPGFLVLSMVSNKSK